MIIQEPTETILIPSAATTRRRRLRLSLLLAVVGLGVFVGSCAFTGTTMGTVLLVSAGALGVASILCTLITMKRWPISANTLQGVVEHAER